MSRTIGDKSDYDFLEEFTKSEAAPYTTAPWLLSDFTQDCWTIKTNHQTPYEINWKIPLWDQSLLTDSKNDILLSSLKHLIIISANGVHQEFSNLSPVSQNRRLAHTFRIIDYLLIHAKDYRLVEFGLGGLDSDDLKAILNQISSSPTSDETVYSWRSHVSKFCNEACSKLTEAEQQEIFLNYPDMLELNLNEEDKLALDIELSNIPKIRASLMKAGLYYGNPNNGYVVNTILLSSLIYPGTIYGRQTSKTGFTILNFYPKGQNYYREFASVKVYSNETNKLLRGPYFNYRHTLITTSRLSTLSLPHPSDTDAIADYIPVLAEPGRIRSVPSANLLRLFRRSIEFHIQHGREVLNGFIRIAGYCKAKSIKMYEISNPEFLRLIGSELRALGVSKLGFSVRRGNRPSKYAQDKYYKNLRSNHGLLELIYVYLGSAQLVIGILMARRADELVTLDTLNCLDKSNSWLNFSLAKSTQKAFGMRQRESRPIDAIAVEMIEELRRLQKILKRLGVIHNLKNLFATPLLSGDSGLEDCTTHLYNRHLDLACDYFESDLNDAGERYYVRQHQLRRFFAIMFFYTNSFGDLDTLRWMLGHHDVEHVWHYLTESLGPNELRGAGARYFTDLAKEDRLDNYRDLQQLLYSTFGTSTFKLIDEYKIEAYLEAILEEGKARIEPQFYTNENGKFMRVLFIINREEL